MGFKVYRFRTFYALKFSRFPACWVLEFRIFPLSRLQSLWAHVQSCATSLGFGVSLWIFSLGHCLVYLVGPDPFGQLIEYATWVWATGSFLVLGTLLEILARVSAQGWTRVAVAVLAADDDSSLPSARGLSSDCYDFQTGHEHLSFTCGFTGRRPAGFGVESGQGHRANPLRLSCPPHLGGVSGEFRCRRRCTREGKRPA